DGQLPDRPPVVGEARDHRLQPGDVAGQILLRSVHAVRDELAEGGETVLVASAQVAGVALGQLISIHAPTLPAFPRHGSADGRPLEPARALLAAMDPDR